MSSLRYSGPFNFYKQLAEIPVPTSGKFIYTTAQSGVSVARIVYSTRDHDRNVKRSITKTLTLAHPDSPTTSSPVISSVVGQDPSEIADAVYAPSEKRHAILREVSDASGTKKRYVEVWSGPTLEASVDVTQRHGQFHTDDYFKSFSFTPSETALVYSAEANPETSSVQEEGPYQKFRFTPNFGEQLYTKKRPTLFIFRWKSLDESSFGVSNGTSDATVTELSLGQAPDIPVVFGQATFATETRLYATGYEQTNDGMLLGIRSCLNRPTSIWEIILPSEYTDKTTTVARKIEIPGRSSRSPRILFDKDRVPTTLFWLSNPLGGAHASTVSLHARDLKGHAGDRLLVDTVHDPLPKEFPGLYPDSNLNDSPFLRLGSEIYILVQSLWGSRVTLLLVDVETGAVIDAGDQAFSWTLHGTDGAHSVICSRSTPTSPPETVLMTLTQGIQINVQVLDKPTVSPQLQEAIDRLDVQILPIPDRHPVETIVIRSKEFLHPRKPICMTILHGGPHASNVTSFTPSVLAYALEGYTVSLPNYTGSTGFGEKYVQKLIGKCGTLDVEDCIATVQHLIKLGLSEPGRQVVQGGSHGGFLTAHFIGRYPGVFRAAAVRNPVISAGEFCTSDITDWAFCEFGLPYGPGAHVTPENYATLYAASPIAHVDCVETPMLVMLGEDDLRVPPAQGRGYYHALKGRGKEVELLVFPKEGHALDGVEAARVSFEAMRDWFRAFTEV